MSLTEKITSATVAADEWRTNGDAFGWVDLQAALLSMGFYRIMRGSRPRQVFAYLDGVMYEL